MSLRCSLLGHKYGDAEIEREREEQGSEVVVTVREFEECSRCANRKVVTENKEVTALERSSSSSAPSPSNSESSGFNSETSTTDFDSTTSNSKPSVSNSSPAASDSESGASTEMGADATTEGDDGAEIIGSGGSADSGGSVDSGRSADSSRPVDSNRSAEPSATSDGSTPEPSAQPETTSSGVGNDLEEGQSATDDDGVILDGDEDEGVDSSDDRQPGEWPEAEATHPEEADESGYTEWPEVGREDEGFDAEPDSEGDSADVDFGGSLTPESAPEVDDESEEVEFVNAEGDTLEAREPRGGNSGPSSGNSELSSGISAGAEAPSLSGPADDPEVDAEFVCPECEYREAVAGSSLRAGDICPECARGYLAKE